MSEAFVYLIKSLFQIYIIVVLLRCLLQIARADFYNPVSQAVVKLTQPLLQPLRRAIPSIGRVDTSSLVLAIIVYAAMVSSLSLFAFGRMLPWHLVLSASVFGVVNMIVSIYFFAIIIGAITSWIPALQQHPITQLVWQLAEPVLSPFRRLIPNMGGLDISPIFALLVLQFLQKLMASLVYI